METKKICCFLENGEKTLGYGENTTQCDDLKDAMRDEITHLITEQGVTHFISGMERGIATYAAEIVLELKRMYPFITLESAIAYETQAEEWGEEARVRYYDLLARCDVETMLHRQYTPDCTVAKDRYMIDGSGYVLTVWDECDTDLAAAVQYAREKGKRIVCIDPGSFA